MSKRSAPDQGSSLSIDENRRASKRLKVSPATPAAPVASPLERCVARLLDIIPKMPSNLIIEGLNRTLDRVVDEAALATPGTYNNILRYINLQITTLTEAGQVEAIRALLAEEMTQDLSTLKDLLAAAHEASQDEAASVAMPPPSYFALKAHWIEAQKGPNAILCLRPPERRGLPLITLHEAFLCFVNESKKPLPTTEVAALKAAFQLCEVMAEPYEIEQERRDAFNAALDPFIGRETWLPEFLLGEKPGMTGRIDGGLVDYSLLREDKGEVGSSGDPYMQIARGFQAFVMWKQSQRSGHGQPGVAKFLLILAGPFLMIAGGFYDGESTIVEPLTPSMIMLPDYSFEGRPMAIAQCLFALKKALGLIRTPPEQAVIAATPCIYFSVVSSDDAEIPITFVKPLPRLGPLIFLATATIENKTENYLVKLVYGRYRTEVHRLLARDGLAPGLVGVRIKQGAPTAVAMEYLKPYSRGSEGWSTLYSLADKLRTSDTQKRLAIAVHEIVTKLEQANLVHGDLRANNLMVHVNADGTVLDDEKVRVKVLDFDWSGRSGEVTYPMWRNTDISWPAETGEDIVVGHDQALVETWWKKMFPEQAYPPVG